MAVNQNNSFQNIQYEKSFKFFKRFLFSLSIIPIIVAGIIFFYINKNFEPAEYSGKLPCVSFTPDNFSRDILYSEEELEKSLLKIKEYSNCVRTYSVTRGLEKIPKIAEKLGMEVVVGAWLTSTEPAINIEEIKNLIEIGKTQKNIKYIVVGNETILLGTLQESELILFINKVKAGIYGTNDKNKIAEISTKNIYPPITTAEFAHVWLRHPSLVKAVDIIGLHSFPYWASQPLEKAIDFTQKDFSAMASITAKPVVLLEAGWPTDGPNQGYAKSGLLNQRKYYQMLDSNFGKIGIFYSIAEMFDVPAKITTTEGLVGPHWGIFDKDGNHKKILYPKDMFLWFFSYIILTSIMIWYFKGFFRYPFVKNDPYYLRKKDVYLEQGILISFSLILILISIMSYGVMRYSMLLGSNLILLQIMCGIVSFYAFFEISQKLMQFFISKHAIRYLNSKYPRLNKDEIEMIRNSLVSIHIAARDEDSDQIIKTIKSALSQTHERVEVIYVDNNSKNKDSFDNIKKYFDNIDITGTYGAGKKIKLFFESSIYGFKAGALNYALKHSDEDSRYIAIMDSDYEANSDWIETGLEYMKEDVGFVQFPQAYRNKVDENFIEMGSRLEQDYVFKVMYPMRAMLGNIVMNGTMVIINREAWKSQYWPTWSICEDGALGAEIISAGYTSSYVPTVMGYGRAPKTFSALCKQRNRWVFGSMQILKMWVKDKDLKWNNTLSLYLSDWFGWIMHGLYPAIFLFTISFILSVWLVYLFILFDWTFYLGLIFVSISLGLFKFNIFKYLLYWQSGLSAGKNIKYFFKSTMSLVLLELSVVNTICYSIVQSIFLNKKKFHVTKASDQVESGAKSGIGRYKKYFNIKLALSVIFPICSIIIAIYGAILMNQKVLFPTVLVLFGQILIVFMPQVVYLIYKLRY